MVRMWFKWLSMVSRLSEEGIDNKTGGKSRSDYAVIGLIDPESLKVGKGMGKLEVE